MWLDFIYLPAFERHAEGIVNDDDMIGIEDRLMADPGAGQLVKGAGGARKLRVALPGRGRSSGGARIIYYYVSSSSEVFFLDVYAKNMKETLTDAETARIYDLVKRLKESE